jgi:hypothetical protein
MSRNFRIWEDAQTVPLLAPAADAAGRTSVYISLQNAQKAFVHFLINQGDADTIVLSVLQAYDEGGDGGKAVGTMPYAYNEAVATSDVMTLGASEAATYTTAATEGLKLIIFEVDPIHCMDLNNLTDGPFSHIAVQTGASNSANITSAWVVLQPLRNASNANLTTYV